MNETPIASDQRTVKGQATLRDLKEKGLERLDWRTLFTITGEELGASDISALDEYFGQFVKPGPCISCGSRLGAKDVVDSFLGGNTFQWGLANGEGFCSKCKYPARAYHRHVGPVEFLSFILQYHPDELTPVTHVDGKPNLQVDVQPEADATPLPSKRQSAVGCRYPDGEAREAPRRGINEAEDGNTRGLQFISETPLPLDQTPEGDRRP